MIRRCLAILACCIMATGCTPSSPHEAAPNVTAVPTSDGTPLAASPATWAGHTLCLTAPNAAVKNALNPPSQLPLPASVETIDTTAPPNADGWLPLIERHRGGHATLALHHLTTHERLPVLTLSKESPHAYTALYRNTMFILDGASPFDDERATPAYYDLTTRTLTRLPTWGPQDTSGVLHTPNPGAPDPGAAGILIAEPDTSPHGVVWIRQTADLENQLLHYDPATHTIRVLHTGTIIRPRWNGERVLYLEHDGKDSARWKQLNPFAAEATLPPAALTTRPTTLNPAVSPSGHLAWVSTTGDAVHLSVQHTPRSWTILKHTADNNPAFSIAALSDDAIILHVKDQDHYYVDLHTGAAVALPTMQVHTVQLRGRTVTGVSTGQGLYRTPALFHTTLPPLTRGTCAPLPLLDYSPTA